MPPDEITIGELARRMEAMERRMDAGFTSVARSFDNLQFVHVDRYDAELKALRADRDNDRAEVSEIKERLRWTVRTVSGALISIAVTALVGMVGFLVASGGL